tara:strand:+ start:785 stop:970 length:186 start_codon:yes stop_codon:yes gene_type:complete
MQDEMDSKWISFDSLFINCLPVADKQWEKKKILSSFSCLLCGNRYTYLFIIVLLISIPDIK